MIDTPTAERIATVLHALGETNRLLILHQLLDGPRSVNELAGGIGKSVVTVSHHLGVLLTAGLVEVERRGRFRIYSLAPTAFRRTPGGSGAFEFAGCRVLLDGEPAPVGRKRAKG
jgi:DNA-binding transcriptional ArsR family regulator